MVKPIRDTPDPPRTLSVAVGMVTVQASDKRSRGLLLRKGVAGLLNSHHGRKHVEAIGATYWSYQVLSARSNLRWTDHSP